MADISRFNITVNLDGKVVLKNANQTEQALNIFFQLFVTKIVLEGNNYGKVENEKPVEKYHRKPLSLPILKISNDQLTHS